MPIVSAICPSCSAPLEVDNKTEAGVCKFCGNAFITEKAINNFNIKYEVKADNVIISNKPDMEALLEREEVFTKLKETKKLEKLYEEMVQHYPKRYEGWWGKILLYTDNFRFIQADRSQVDKWYSFVKETAPDDVLPGLEKQYNGFLLGRMKLELKDQKAEIAKLNEVLKEKQQKSMRDIDGAKYSRRCELTRLICFGIPMLFCVIGTIWSHLTIKKYWDMDSDLVPKWAYSSLLLIVVFPLVFIILGWFYIKSQEFFDVFAGSYIRSAKREMANAQEQYDKQYKEKCEVLQQTEAKINAFIQEKELTE
jgi:hypothetical protein